MQVIYVKAPQMLH